MNATEKNSRKTGRTMQNILKASVALTTLTILNLSLSGCTTLGWGKEEKKGELRLRTHFQVRESPFWENALSVEVDQQCLFIRCDSYNTKDQWYRALQEAQKRAAALTSKRDWAGRTISELAPLSFPMSGSS